MAQVHYDAPRGAFTDQIVEAADATSLTGIAVRVIVNDAEATSKTDAIRAIEAIIARIVEDTWPPA